MFGLLNFANPCLLKLPGSSSFYSRLLTAHTRLRMPATNSYTGVLQRLGAQHVTVQGSRQSHHWRHIYNVTYLLLYDCLQGSSRYFYYCCQTHSCFSVHLQ